MYRKQKEWLTFCIWYFCQNKKKSDLCKKKKKILGHCFAKGIAHNACARWHLIFFWSSGALTEHEFSIMMFSESVCDLIIFEQFPLSPSLSVHFFCLSFPVNNSSKHWVKSSLFNQTQALLSAVLFLFLCLHREDSTDRKGNERCYRKWENCASRQHFYGNDQFRLCSVMTLSCMDLRRNKSK